MDELFVDRDAVPDACRRCYEVAAAVQSVRSRLREAMERYDGCWGDDEAGRAIGDPHREAMESVLRDLLACAGTFDGLAENMRIAAGRLEIGRAHV